MKFIDKNMKKKRDTSHVRHKKNFPLLLKMKQKEKKCWRRK